MPIRLHTEPVNRLTTGRRDTSASSQGDRPEQHVSTVIALSYPSPVLASGKRLGTHVAIVTSYRKVMSMHVKLHQEREEQKAPAFGTTRLRKRLTVVVDGLQNGGAKRLNSKSRG